MKKILESKIMLVIITMILSTTVSVIANTVITSNSVSYSNSKTSETTVSGALNELFSAVEINERLGATDISNIGNGTVTGAIKELNTSLSGKQAKITGGATTIATSNLTESRALISNSSGKVAVSAVTSTELGYLDGVTSNVQTQLNSMINPPNLASVSVISENLVKSLDTSYTAPKSGYYKFFTASNGSEYAGIAIYNASKTLISTSSSPIILYAQAETEWMYLKANQTIIYYVAGESRRLYYAPEL